MKSVCILLQNHYEVDIRVRRKAEALVSAGYSVDVLALRSPYSQAKAYALSGVNVYTISLGKKRGSVVRYVFEYLAFFLWASLKLSVLMGRRHYAAVDVNNLPDFLVFAAAYAKRKGAKIVFDMHEITPEFYISKYGIKQNSWMVRVLKYVEKASFDFADHVITINAPIQALLASRGLPASKSAVIMNSVDETMFANAARSPIASDTRETQKRFVMMYHGTLTHIYGLDIALEAFGVARREMPGAELWILGDGPARGALEGLCRKLGLESNVRLIGPVLPQEVPQWLKRCDVGILATRQDVFLDFSFSNKLSEYIIMDKPVICSRLKTIRHYFNEDSLAFFEPNSSASLATQMVRMYQHPQLRAQFAKRAKHEYSPIRWEVMRQRYLELMVRLVGATREAKDDSQTPVAGVVTR
jgi:glycosyltransferase involved in cell wall biosynthesis